ncbi:MULTISPECIES: hypothetical protein [unclassified Campylobacter]|uniref:hypothetical protein n=1 Tax=unclassified Campylobacter TaxID=2593542 RepID=UPI001BD9C272|nr:MULTISPECIES: hypothetical protein [unclassified Campylobacter]MBT0880396.1 hypothetical protein [Campylobacter sp. 2018MI27]MBT0884522.1 hypothetical protein [Campylobacter sp. 2018MI10]MBZ7979655.1 hypothetical protein [Campylobacter sp. RM12642]
MFSFLRLAKSALITSEYSVKNNKLFYKNKEFIIQDELKNYENTYFVVAIDRVILFKNQNENNFDKAKKRQIKAISLSFLVMILCLIILFFQEFEIGISFLSIASIVVFILSILNYSFLKQQIFALEKI